MGSANGMQIAEIMTLIAVFQVLVIWTGMYARAIRKELIVTLPAVLQVFVTVLAVHLPVALLVSVLRVVRNYALRMEIQLLILRVVANVILQELVRNVILFLFQGQVSLFMMTDQFQYPFKFTTHPR
jgi:hypothetical protein